MKSLRMFMLNVNRGLSVFLITPNEYGILIDCGSTQEISPAILYSEMQSQDKTFIDWENHKLAYFILTHPHSDHISDISNVHKYFKPCIIQRRKDLDWNRVRNSNLTSKPLDFYLEIFFHQIIIINFQKKCHLGAMA